MGARQGGEAVEGKVSYSDREANEVPHGRQGAGSKSTAKHEKRSCKPLCPSSQLLLYARHAPVLPGINSTFLHGEIHDSQRSS